MALIHHVTIYCDTGEVHPPALGGNPKVRPGDTVEFQSRLSKQGTRANRDVIVMIPIELGQNRVFQDRTFYLNSGNHHTRRLTVLLDADPGTYVYGAYCYETKDFAKGATAPIMIIDPPEDG